MKFNALGINYEIYFKPTVTMPGLVVPNSPVIT
jgi:hypothetical protein